MRTVSRFVEFVDTQNGVANKETLTELARAEFGLHQSRKVFYCDSFAVRFCHSTTGSFSNTVLSLSALKKFDDKPFLVCLIGPDENKIYLANSTFIIKVSQSSQALTVNKVRGSFNGSDIMRNHEGTDNSGQNVQALFAIHEKIGFDQNLPRIVEETRKIVPKGKKFQIGNAETENIYSSVNRAVAFSKSEHFTALKQDLDARVKKYGEAILRASCLPDSNRRGRIIEYLISGHDESLKNRLVNEINNPKGPQSAFKTENTLGDYLKDFPGFHTETDIKTKLLIRGSNPKAFNVDKFLEYHSKPDTVFLFYFIGIDAEEIAATVLVPAYQEDILSSLKVVNHWSGRTSRGVTQFIGSVIEAFLDDPDSTINSEEAKIFLDQLIQL